MAMIKASELIEGKAFRKPGQRKWRVASSVYPLEPDVTLDGRPGVLVCLHDCSQVVLSENDDLEVPQHPGDLDRVGFAKLGRRRRAERERRAGAARDD